MFRASWAWLCVWGKFCKFLKNQNQIFWKDPLCKNTKTFFILVSLEYPDTFLFHKIFGWSKFSRVWVWICVCRRSKNRPKKRPKSVKKSPRLSLLIIMSSPENQQNRIDILFYYSMHEYSGILACFEVYFEKIRVLKAG